LGYSREQLLTYVLVMTLLRAWVLGCVTDRVPMEIARGMISDVLLRPISHLWYWATQDAANKSLNLLSAVFEVGIFAWLMGSPFLSPPDFKSAALFALSTLGAMVMYFQMSYMLGVTGFWTSESWGPRFCFEIILEFCAGAYFPVDLLPAAVQKVLSALPFPYLIFYPVSVYLGRLSPPEILRGLLMQGLWILLLGFLTRYFWNKGLKKYAAEGR
jgi:ABC-2 type transport system permease protein